MPRSPSQLVNRLSLIASILCAALIVQPAIEYGSGLLVVVIVILLAIAAAHAVAVYYQSKD